MLTQKGRINLAQEPTSLRDSLLRSGLVELPQDGHIGIVSAFLKDFHGDPADRIIAATALVHGSVVLTASINADDRIAIPRTVAYNQDPCSGAHTE